MIEIDYVAAIAREAGEKILEIARRGAMAREKADRHRSRTPTRPRTA